MTLQPMYLLDSTHGKIAQLIVADTGTQYEGAIDLGTTSPELKKLFEEYEEIVEGQMFSLLDAIEEKIVAFSFKVSFENGTEGDIEDLQVYPSTGAVSFKVRRPAVVRGG